MSCAAAFRCSTHCGLRALAGQERNRRVATYLLGMPLLADHLEEGLELFGGSCADFEAGRL